MANSSSKDETDTLPEKPTRIQPYQFEPVRQDFEKVPEHSVSFKAKPHVVFHGVCEIALTEVLATQMGVMRHSKKVGLVELYKRNPLSPHCESIARELVHCYSWGRLQIVTVHGNTVPCFVDHTHIHSLLKNLRWHPHRLRRLTSLPGKLQKIKSIKNPIKCFYYILFH